MAEILFLAHRLPYPPDKGDKIRSWHFLRHLAGRHRVHLGALFDDPADAAHAATLGPLCASLCLRPLSRARLLSRLPGALLRGEAMSVAALADRGLRRWIGDRLAKGVDLVLAFSGASARPFLDLAGPPLLLDLVDSDSEKWRELAAGARGAKRLVLAREARLVLAHERRSAARAARTLLVSEPEADLARGLIPEQAGRIEALPNGVDGAVFDPALAGGSPYGAGGPPVIVFTGAMDYAPNIAAVSWFAQAVMPRLLASGTPCRFAIVGSRPSREVLALAREPDILVTGRVPDVRPYLGHAAAAVAPLRLARGLQNKVLEAMAMALPVVASASAAQGIEAEPGRHLQVADDAEAVAVAVRALLADPDGARALGRRARARVLERHGWPEVLARLDGLVEGALGLSARP